MRLRKWIQRERDREREELSKALSNWNCEALGWTAAKRLPLSDGKQRIPRGTGYAGNGWARSPIWEFINEGLGSKADNKLIKSRREALKIMLPNE